MELELAFKNAGILLPYYFEIADWLSLE